MGPELLLGVALWICTALANVEKTIFLGPPTVRVPQQHPTLDDLRIDTLTPSNFSLRTHIEAIFPNKEHRLGKAIWLLLDGLAENQRYEVRVCWAATQPTDFSLRTYELDAVFETPELITSLWEYSMSRQSQDDSEENLHPRVHLAAKEVNSERIASLLFLQIWAAADYYTTNATLMARVPPVYADVILDPFLLNVLPRSLAPIGIWILAVAIISYFVACWAVSRIQATVTRQQAVQEKKRV